MKYLLILTLFLGFSCKKEKKETPPPIKSIPKNPISENPDKDITDINKAIRNQDFEKVRKIVYAQVPEEEANQQIEKLIKTHGYHNVLLWGAAPIGDFDSVKEAVESGKANIEIEIGGKGTPLLSAAQAGSLEIVEYLLKKKANPNAQTAMGATALSIAVGIGNYAMIDLLTKHGASFQRGGDPGHKEFSILNVAIAKKDINMLEYLLKKGADPNGGHGLPLAFAIMNKDIKSIELLANHGADLNFKGKLGFRPLMTAAVEGDETIIKKLISLGAKPKLKDDRGQSALDWAKKYKSPGVKILEKY